MPPSRRTGVASLQTETCALMSSKRISILTLGSAYCEDTLSMSQGCCWPFLKCICRPCSSEIFERSLLLRFWHTQLFDRNTQYDQKPQRLEMSMSAHWFVKRSDIIFTDSINISAAAMHTFDSLLKRYYSTKVCWLVLSPPPPPKT